MSIYDVALMAPSTNIDGLASNVCQLFLGALLDAKSKAVRVETERLALLYDPIVFINFVTSKDLDKNTRGYHIECSAYSELVVALMAALDSIGLPRASEPGFSEVTNTTKIGVKIKISLGYSTNPDDTAILKNKANLLISEFTKILNAPAKYVKIYNDKILTVDPDLEGTGLRVLAESQQAGCSTVFSDILLDSKPTRIATISRETSGSEPYRVAMAYKTDDIEVVHQLIFSARLRPGHTTPTKLVVYAGDTRKELVIKTNDFMIFKVDFFPERYPLYRSHFGMDIMVTPPPKKVMEIPFSINVINNRFWLDKDIPITIDVSSNYDVYFGVTEAAKIDLAGIWVCKRGVLDILDDPMQMYTTYPNVYDPTQSVDAAIPLNPSVKQRVETTSSSFLTKATILPIKQFETFMDDSIAKMGQLENALKQYTTSLTETLGGLSNMAGGKFPVINLDKVNINFGAIESALGDPNCAGERKALLQKMVNKMKTMDRAVEAAKETGGASLVKQVAAANEFANGAIKDNMVNIGTNLKNVTAKLTDIEKTMASSTQQLNTVTDQAMKQIQVATAGLKMPDSPIISKALQGIPGLSLPQNLGVAKELSNINSVVAGLNSEIAQAMGSLNTSLSVPLKGIPGMPVGLDKPTKAGLKTGDGDLIQTSGIAGLDYAKYWPPR